MFRGVSNHPTIPHKNTFPFRPSSFFVYCFLCIFLFLNSFFDSIKFPKNNEFNWELRQVNYVQRNSLIQCKDIDDANYTKGIMWNSGIPK